MSEIRGLFDCLNDMGVIQINITGGEPMARKDIFEILDYTAEFGDDNEWLLLTNGTLWNRAKIQRLKRVVEKQPNFTVQISLDSLSLPVYDNFRAGRPGDLERVEQTAREMTEQGIKTDACICVTKLNADHVVETAKFALDELGVNGVHVIHLFPSGRAMSHYWELEPSIEQWGRVVMEFTRIRKEKLWGDKSGKISMSYFNFYEFFYALMSQGGTPEDMKVWGYSSTLHNLQMTNGCAFCKAGYEDMCVSSVGDVYPCMCSRSSDVVAGNIRERSPQAIYDDSPVFKWFRTKRVWEVKEPCRSCPFNGICLGGCRVSAYNMTGDLYSADMRCPRANGSLNVPEKWVNQLSRLVDLP